MFGEAITAVIWSCEMIVSNRGLWPKLLTFGNTCNFSLAVGIYILLKSCKISKSRACFPKRNAGFFIVPSAGEGGCCGDPRVTYSLNSGSLQSAILCRQAHLNSPSSKQKILPEEGLTSTGITLYKQGFHCFDPSAVFLWNFLYVSRINTPQTTSCIWCVDLPCHRFKLSSHMILSLSW